MTDAQPTSAQLQQTQQALAASQADLTRALAERDEALAAQARLGDRLTEGAVRLAMHRSERADLRERLVAAWAERDEARHELAHAEFRTTTLRSQVAHLAVERNALGQQLDVVLAAEASPPDLGAGPREEHP